MSVPKNRALAAVLLALCALAPAAASAADVPADALARSVLQVRTAEYDRFDKYWKSYSYGSAVYVGDGFAVTNAHVVAGEDGKPTGAYMVCWSADWRKAPDTCVPALLTRFDADSDLAVLTLDLRMAAGSALPPAAKFADAPSDVGDALRMVGYPRNGGETVTVTEGKVSGQEEDTGNIKLDANVDAGNSGGGVFTPDGRIAGITESASVGYSTLAIAIPAQRAAAAVAAARAASGALEADAAKKYLQSVAAVGATRRLGSIDTPLLRLRKFGSFGFVLERAVETDDGAAAYYHFGNQEAHDTHVSLLPSSGGGKPQPWWPATAKADLEKSYQRVAVVHGVRIGGLKVDDLYLATGPRTQDDDPDAVVATGNAGKLGFIIVGTRKNPGAFRRALALVGVSTRKDSTDWTEVRLSDDLRTKLPQGWTYRQALDSKDLTRAVNATVDGRHVAGGLGVFSISAKAVPDVRAYVENYVQYLAQDGGPRAQWAGVLEGSGGSAPFVRIAWRDGKEWAQASVFVWDGGDGQLTVGYAIFSSEDQSAARKAADLFAQATRQSKPFGLQMGDVQAGNNLLPAQDGQ